MRNFENKEKLTLGQLERDISQKTLAFYKQKMGLTPGKVVSKISDTIISIVIEDSITPVEKLLIQADNIDLAISARMRIFSIVRSEYIRLVETILDVKICDFIAGISFETGRTSATLVLEKIPQTR